MVWQKGQSGNPKGRPRRGESIAEACREVLEECGRSKCTYAQQLAKKARILALKGDIRWAEFLRDSAEGRPAQRHVHSGDDDGGAIRFTFDIGKPDDDRD